jgi:hypothetical protein
VHKSVKKAAAHQKLVAAYFGAGTELCLYRQKYTKWILTLDS